MYVCESMIIFLCEPEILVFIVVLCLKRTEVDMRETPHDFSIHLQGNAEFFRVFNRCCTTTFFFENVQTKVTFKKLASHAPNQKGSSLNRTLAAF